MISIILKLLFWIVITVLLLVFILLFYPVLYKGKINARRFSFDELDSLIRIRILSVLLILEFRKQEEDLELYLRVLGIKIRLDGKDKKNAKYKDLKYSDVSEKETDKSAEKINEAKMDDSFVSKLEEEKTEDNDNIFLRFIKKAKERIQSLIRFLRMTKEKKEKYVKLYETESFQRAFNKVKSVFPKLIKHIAPRKVKGDIRFGLEECDSTGKFFGYYSVICSYFTYDLRVVPDFEHEVFEGDIVFKGRVFPIYLICYGLGFLLNRDVKLTYRRFKKINRR